MFIENILPKKIQHTIQRTFLVALTAAGLLACGGSGNGSVKPNILNITQPPKVNIPSTQIQPPNSEPKTIVNGYNSTLKILNLSTNTKVTVPSQRFDTNIEGLIPYSIVKTTHSSEDSLIFQYTPSKVDSRVMVYFNPYTKTLLRVVYLDNKNRRFSCDNDIKSNLCKGVIVSYNDVTGQSKIEFKASVLTASSGNTQLKFSGYLEGKLIKNPVSLKRIEASSQANLTFNNKNANVLAVSTSNLKNYYTLIQFENGAVIAVSKTNDSAFMTLSSQGAFRSLENDNKIKVHVSGGQIFIRFNQAKFKQNVGEAKTIIVDGSVSAKLPTMDLKLNETVPNISVKRYNNNNYYISSRIVTNNDLVMQNVSLIHKTQRNDSAELKLFHLNNELVYVNFKRNLDGKTTEFICNSTCNTSTVNTSESYNLNSVLSYNGSSGVIFADIKGAIDLQGR